MATIDIGDNDQVFVVTRSAEENPPKFTIHELGKNDLMIVVERSDPDKEGIQCVPKVMIYVGGEPVWLIQELNLKASSKEGIAWIEFKVLSRIEGASDQLRSRANKSLELLRRLLPFVNIKEVGLDDEVLHEQGLNLSVQL